MEFARKYFFPLSIAALVVLAAGFWILKKNIFFTASHDTTKTLSVVVSQPLALYSAKSSADSVRLAFEQAGYKAGEYTLELIERNDGDELTGAWDPKKEEENARFAASDPSVIAYIGPMNSGAAKVSIPILNRAGIVQISQANTWPGLTKVGFAPGEPGIFYPTGIQTYFRDVATDEIQGPAAALWASNLGFKTAMVIDDGEAYGKGIADIFRGKAQGLGLRIISQQTIDKRATAFAPLVTEIVTKHPDMIYCGIDLPNGIVPIIIELRHAGYKGGIMAPDGALDQDFITRGGIAAEGVFITSVGEPVASMQGVEAQKYRADYIARYKSEPDIYGAFAYEAARIIIRAIGESNGSRASMLAKMHALEDFPSMYGPLTFDENGDVNQKIISANTVAEGKFVFLKTLTLPQ